MTITPGMAERLLIEARENGSALVDGATLEYLLAVAQRTDGIRLDPATGAYVARHTIYAAGRTEDEARAALTEAVHQTAGSWTDRSPGPIRVGVIGQSITGPPISVSPTSGAPTYWGGTPAPPQSGEAER